MLLSHLTFHKMYQLSGVSFILPSPHNEVKFTNLLTDHLMNV